MAHIIKTRLTLLLAFVVFSISANAAKLPRPEFVGSDLDNEAYLLNISGGGRPQGNLVMTIPKGYPIARSLVGVTLRGDLKMESAGLFRIGNQTFVLMNVDWRDRGFNQETNKYIQTLLGKKSRAECEVQLQDGPFACVLYQDGANVGAKILRQGWKGWQKETGGRQDPHANTEAIKALRENKGVWADRMYFPDSTFRNAYGSPEIWK